MSVAVTTRSGRSCLSASAIAPLPVPTSTTLAPCGQLEADLDEQLGLRARDEHAAVDGEVEVAEAAAAEQVGHRLAIERAAADELLERARGRPGDREVAVGVERGAIDPERLGEQQLGVQARGVDARGLERHQGRVQRVAHRRAGRAAAHAVVACSSSLRRFSSFCSAFVKPSSSPSRTCSRLCCVSLMRWSVTRRSP